MYVTSERSRVPSGRLLRFSPGSQDEIIANSLKTGDLILFQRDPTLYFLPGALVCALRSYRSGCQFDQAGVIVMVKGEPYVLERSLSGQIRCRPYDARIKCSRSATILLRPTSLLLSPSERKSATEYSNTLTSLPAPLEPLFLIQEVVSLLVNPDFNSSITLVNDFYSRIEILKGKDANLESSNIEKQTMISTTSSTMRDLAAPVTPRHFAFGNKITNDTGNKTDSDSNRNRKRSRDIYVRDKLL